MNDEQRKLIADLNRKHFTEFGVAPDGRLRFQWMRTDEMPIEFLDGTKESLDPETGLWIARSDYRKRTFAETYGQGICWTIAFLEPPVPRELWLMQHGLDFPWPSNGFYRPIDCISLHKDILPDEDLSMRAAFNIRTALETVAKGHEFAFHYFLEQHREAAAQRDKAIASDLESMLNDATPAFGNNPGGKTHVSLPTHRTN